MLVGIVGTVVGVSVAVLVDIRELVIGGMTVGGDSVDDSPV